MKKDLLERAENFAKNTYGTFEHGGTLYFTKNPINNDLRFKGKKYFFCYATHHAIKYSFKTQAELSEFLSEFGY